MVGVDGIVIIVLRGSLTLTFYFVLVPPSSLLGRGRGRLGAPPSWVGVGVALCGPSPAWVGAALGVSGLRASLLGFPSGVLRWGGFPSPPWGRPVWCPLAVPPPGFGVAAGLSNDDEGRFSKSALAWPWWLKV